MQSYLEKRSIYYVVTKLIHGGNMTVQTTFNKFSNDVIKAQKCEQTVLACSIDTAMKGGVDKILCARAQISSLRIVPSDGSAEISGKLNVKALYLNAEGAPESADYISDFSKTVACPSAKEGCGATASAKVLDVRAAAEGDTLKIQTVVELCPSVAVNSGYELLENAEGAFLKRGESTFCRFVGYDESVCTVDEQYSTGAVVEKVLAFDSNARICKVTPDGAGAIAEGEACVTIVYVSDGKAVQKNMTLPFVQRIATAEGARCDVKAEVRDSKLVIGGPATENVFDVKVDVALTAAVYENTQATLVTDAYCPAKELKLSHLCLSYEDYCDTVRTRERISGSVDAGVDGIGISRIVAAFEKDNAIATVDVGDDFATVEGVLAVTVVYLDDNEDYKSADIDLPYSVVVGISEGCDTVKTEAESCDLTAKVKRDSEIEVTATVCVRATCGMTKRICAVDGVEEGEDIAPCEDSVSIYYVKKGETLWDIAKKLSMSPEDIAAQNGGISDAPDEGEKVVVYREVAV